jgi:hypothetical protein
MHPVLGQDSETDTLGVCGCAIAGTEMIIINAMILYKIKSFLIVFTLSRK